MMLQDLESGLFALAAVLRYPVMMLLWASVLWTLFQVGRFALDSLHRHRLKTFKLEDWLRGKDLASASEQLQTLGWYPARLMGLAGRLNREGRLDEVEIDQILAQILEEVRHQADAARVLTRVAPSLGLLGTLIPMGAALAAVSTGQLDEMSGQMVVAFSTTVVGLACGTVAFFISVVQQRWISRDSRDCRYLAEWCLAQAEGNAES